MKTKKYYKAITTISRYLQENPNEAWDYHVEIANISLLSGGTKLKSHENTSKLMLGCFGIDTSKLPQYKGAIKRDIGNKNVWDNT